MTYKITYKPCPICKNSAQTIAYMRNNLTSTTGLLCEKCGYRESINPSYLQFQRELDDEDYSQFTMMFND